MENTGFILNVSASRRFVDCASRIPEDMGFSEPSGSGRSSGFSGSSGSSGFSGSSGSSGFSGSTGSNGSDGSSGSSGCSGSSGSCGSCGFSEFNGYSGSIGFCGSNGSSGSSGSNGFMGSIESSGTLLSSASNLVCNADFDAAKNLTSDSGDVSSQQVTSPLEWLNVGSDLSVLESSTQVACEKIWLLEINDYRYGGTAP